MSKILLCDNGLIVTFSYCTVRCMMFGFGDDKNPYTESVDLLEDLVIDYINEMVSIKSKAVAVGNAEFIIAK